MRRTYKPIVVNLMADGKLIPYNTFMAFPFVVDAQNNFELLSEANRILDPNYHEKEQIRRKSEFAQKRRKELQEQQTVIGQQLKELT